MDEFAGFAVDVCQMDDGASELFAHGLDRFVGFDPRAERAGHGADAALNPFREPVGEDCAELIGVFEAFSGLPIGGIHILFDPRLVELAEGESVDGERIHLMFGEQVESAGDLVDVGELRGGV